MTDVSPSPSGLAAVDRQWGGLASGRAYLLVGRAGAGRSALALQTVRAAVEARTRCLVISPRPPDELVEVGHDVGLDLAAAHTGGYLRLLRIPQAAELAARGSEGLAKSYRDLAALVASDGPGRVVIEDFTPLVQFDTFERFHDAFGGLVRALRAQGTTLVIGLGDPANDASRRLLRVVEGLVDGTIRLGAGGDLVLGTPDEAGYPSGDGSPVEAAPLPGLAPPAPAPPSAAPPASPRPPETSIPSPEPPSDGLPTTSTPPSAPARDTPPEPTRSQGVAGPPATEVIAPPPPDPALLAPPADALEHDPADALVSQGYLADSRGDGAADPTPATVPVAAPLPAFTPLAATAPDPNAAFRAALDAAFADRASGTPFVAVALRMDPSAPEAAQFDAVAAGLGAALRPADRLLVDAARKRAAVVLPSSGPDAAQALFAGLQAHLRADLGPDADRVLQSVAAVTVPDGQPFQTSAELLRHTVER
ncbi:ATPase domain-containing protein [Rubrivirga sp.]|uniref:ATPase domain-containing protein n=1 Tax=Rubrivirga sp. TaxID=1885344 RepID=UPI003B51CAC1